MKRLVIAAVLAAVIAPVSVAQDDTSTLTVNVNLRPPVKLFLDGHELPVAAEESLPDVPLHLVFVLDNGGHQQGMMSLAKDYVVKLASSIRNSQSTYTALSAAKEPVILAEATDAATLASALTRVDTPANSTHEESADLNAGIVQAAKLLGTTPGARTIVVFSDDDDDIAGKVVQKLKAQMAGEHIRLFSILLAQHDFYGTKARTAWGVRLNTLANFSGGAQYDTYWQNRRSDEIVLKTVAARISSGSLVSFTIPASLNLKPGIYTLKAASGDGKALSRTSPFLLAH